ncbi:MAG: sialidase family protein [Actinomycetes bacterium]
MRRRPILALACGAAAAALVIPALASSPGVRGARAPIACDSSRPAVAHHASQVVLAQQPRLRPVPCGGTTGYASAESHIVALPSGEIAVAPAVLPGGFLGTDTPPVAVRPNTQSNASPAGLLVTTNAGEHWTFVRPSGATWNPTDHSEYVDRSTGRLFFEDYGPISVAASFGAAQEGPAHINWSPDGGITWHHGVIASVFMPENPRFMAAVAPAHARKPHGYPNVLYFCADTNVGFSSPAIVGRLCFRSFDGGLSWRRAAVLFNGTVPQHHECRRKGEDYYANDAQYPQAARDGSLYVMVTCAGATYLARSTDEAATFPIVHVGGRPLTIPADEYSDLQIAPDGTMYVMSKSGPHLMLRASANRGRTWTRAVDVTAPGVVGVMQWTLTVGAHDTLAVSYLGHRGGQTTWNAFVTATRSAHALLRPGAGPVFWSVQLNTDDAPLLYGSDIEGAGQVQTIGGRYRPVPPGLRNSQSIGDEFIGATLTTDGTPWASFTTDCGPAPDTAGCRATNDQTRGYVGYLRWPG